MTLMLLRSAHTKDLNDIHHLAETSGVGVTSLSKDIKILKQRLNWSSNSFKETIHAPSNEFYLFVLEDPVTKKVIGTSAVEALTGQSTPLYSYKLSKRTRFCNSLKLRTDYEVLYLVNDNQNRSELCTLFLDKSYRLKNYSTLLSRGRFLYMANFPERFASMVIAEMRGICDDQGNSPFWDSLGTHFFNMTFAQADRLTLSSDKQFIADLMPRNPIYVSLLSQTARDVIGQPHASTIPAMKILNREGFRYNNYVDIFDGGPTLEAFRDQIRTIAASRLLTVKNLIDDVGGKSYLLSNTHSILRATLSEAILNPKQQSCILSKETAELLKVKSGEQIRIVPLNIEESSVFTQGEHERSDKT
jgi:arginine N-succinyltransferase